ncbi:head-tail connector protein [Sphingopyxis sp. PET50]|uniref:head-tail connector protein n=1 Tax=Sphingopyxis sp. PET50 TaxID=2976533 RepID=UPI0021B07B39|nr:head-tail connector protein [Sphingopyxis sp. PET50]
MAKDQIRVRHNDEDALIMGYVVASLAWLERYCGDNYDVYAPELDQAQLLLIAHWYENRSTVDSGNVIPREIPFAVEALAGPFRLPTIA